MRRFVCSRILQGLIVIAGAMTISFLLTDLLGNPIDALAGLQVDAHTKAQIAHAHGYDRPLGERFLAFMGGALHGDFGESFRRPVHAVTLVLDALPYTLYLVFGAMAVSMAVALPVSVWAVLHRDSTLDKLMRRLLMLFQGVPEFFAGLVLVLVFAVSLGWVPSIGVDGPRSYILPILALSLPLISTLARLVRSELLDIMGMEFIIALRAKGLPSRVILTRHAMRNALPPIVTYLALQLGWLVGGTLGVEAVFGLPGIGSLALSATSARDMPVIQAIVVTVAVGYVLFNLVADLAVAALDPRVRLGS